MLLLRRMASERKTLSLSERRAAPQTAKGLGDANMIEKQPVSEGLIRSRDAARYLCMSEWLLRKLAHEGKLPYVQITDRSPMLFDRADLRAWIERQKIRK